MAQVDPNRAAPGTADLRRRAWRVLHRAARIAVRHASAATLAAIVAAEDPVELFAVAARDVPPPSPPASLGEIDAARRTATYKSDLLERAGGALTTEQVRILLGWRSGREVRAAAAKGRLLAVADCRGKLFPAFQFVGGEVLPGVAQVIAASGETSAWAVLQYLVEGDEGLGDDLPMELLRCGPADVERVVLFARKLAA